MHPFAQKHLAFVSLKSFGKNRKGCPE